MKIAVTYDNGQVWQHFGKTTEFKFYDCQDGRVISTEIKGTRDASHGALADFLHENGAEIVICGGVGAPMIGRLEAYGMKACPGVTGEADVAVSHYLEGTLKGNGDAVHDGCHHH